MFLFWTILVLMTVFAMSLLIIPFFLWAHRSWLEITVIISVLIFFPMLSFTAYHYWGSSARLAVAVQYQEHEQQAQVLLRSLGSTNAVISKLRQVIAKRSGDWQGWYLLGKLTMSVGQYQQAVDAFTQANHLKPHDNEVMKGLAQALFFSQGRRLSSRSLSLLKQIRKKSPKDQTALNLLALNAFMQHRYGEALQYWRIVLAQLPPGSEDAQLIQEMMKRAEKKSARKNGRVRT